MFSLLCSDLLLMTAQELLDEAIVFPFKLWLYT